MAKQWEKRGDNSAYMYITNGMYFRVDKGINGEWYAGLNLRTLNASHAVMDWEFEASSIESAKDLAYSKLKLWLQELAEGV